MDPLTILLISNALTAFICLGLVGSKRKTVRKLLEAKDEVMKLDGQSNRLLQANDDLTKEGITDERIDSYVRSHPNVINSNAIMDAVREKPELVQTHWINNSLSEDKRLRDRLLDAYLKDHRITHSWQTTGSSKMVIGDKETGFTDKVISEKCLRCGLVHRYFEGSGSPEKREFEGYFMGGQRLDTKMAPECLKLRLVKTPEENAA
jgi:hypothetical protein